MDLHILPGIKANEVAEAHRRDMLVQDEHNCTCMTYWIDEKRGSVFCLIEAPDKEAVEAMHGQAHGLIPNRIIEVSSGLVESFLGRIHDPETTTITNDGLKVFTDPSFRVLLVMHITDPVLVKHNIGKDIADKLLNEYYSIVRQQLAACGGREVEYEGYGFIASFTTAAAAMACAKNIEEQMLEEQSKALGLRMAIHCGDPVGDSAQLFGNSIEVATQLCFINKKKIIAVSAAVRELLVKEDAVVGDKQMFSLSRPDEAWLQQLFAEMEKHWQDAGFNADEFCRAMAMSVSQFYRKAVALTGLSPNLFLKDFRLHKAKQVLQQKRCAIAEVAFQTGFSSASYFTKCFKSKYKLLPLAYLALL